MKARTMSQNSQVPTANLEGDSSPIHHGQQSKDVPKQKVQTIITSSQTKDRCYGFSYLHMYILCMYVHAFVMFYAKLSRSHHHIIGIAPLRILAFVTFLQCHVIVVVIQLSFWLCVFTYVYTLYVHACFCYVFAM